MHTWKLFSSCSTFSNDFFLEAAEKRAWAYRPSIPNTWIGACQENRATTKNKMTQSLPIFYPPSPFHTHTFTTSAPNAVAYPLLRACRKSSIYSIPYTLQHIPHTVQTTYQGIESAKRPQLPRSRHFYRPRLDHVIQLVTWWRHWP